MIGSRPSFLKIYVPFSEVDWSIFIKLFFILFIFSMSNRVNANPDDQALNLNSDQSISLSQNLANSYNQLQISGFGVGGYSYQPNTNQSTFFGNKLAVSFFKPVNTSLYFFGQLTTALEGGDTGIEIDNLIISYTPASLSQLTIMGGKFDAPVGFERDDEPLNFLPDNSYNFELGRPVKLTGITAMYNINPIWNLTAYVTNGWNQDIDNNGNKTVGGRVGFYPGEKSSLGLSFMHDTPNSDAGNQNRYLTNFDYTLQPCYRLIIAGEFNYGVLKFADAAHTKGIWSGGQITGFYSVTHHTGLALRYDIFQDTNGVRTGTSQTLQSFSLAPSFRLNTGQMGTFTTREHTNIKIPEFEIRLEVRENHSTVAYFPKSGGNPSNWDMETQLQTVIVF